MTKFLIHLLFSSLLLTNVISIRNPDIRPIRQRTCGTVDPPADLTSTHNWLRRNEEHNNDLWNASMIQNHIRKHPHLQFGKRRMTISDYTDPYQIDRRQLSSALFTVDTYIHIVADSGNAEPNSAHYVTNDQIQKQLNYLNNAFAAVGVAYKLIGITRTVNDTWARNGDDLAMKKALRQGTYSALNIYYQTLLQSSDPNLVPTPGSFLLGFCTLPTAGITSSSPPRLYVADGCNVLSGTLPGSWQYGYNQGGTTAHEVGHWNGLLHTFQGNTCDKDDWGDYVADTPQEGDSAAGCPRGRDTCPNSGIGIGVYDGTGMNQYGPQGYSGPDPVHNFMDYTTDACYEEFTPGQGARMVNLWVIYRQGR